MNKCIYITDSTESLQYTSEEHVIPAGLGGIQKLPKGYVSDKANNLFSKYELTALRHSLLTSNRLRHGPGKRGNQDVNKQENQKIQLLKDETSEPNQFLLGHIFSGKSYIPPQLLCEFSVMTNTLKVNIIADNYEIDDYEAHLLKFKRLLNEFLLNRNRVFDIVVDTFKESKNSINIGIYDKKWYVSTNIPSFDMNILATKILSNTFQNLLYPRKTNLNTSIEDRGQLKLRFSQSIDITNNSFGFTFVKTAFNVMAYLKGQAFALQNIFDILRKDIIECNNMSNYMISNQIHEEVFSSHINSIPDNSHCVYIVSKGNIIYAYVSMYNEWHAHLVLTEQFNGINFAIGFVCDWKNKKEYTIE